VQAPKRFRLSLVWTTVCKFRYLLEAHNLGDQLFALIGEYLQENGLKVCTGTILDATIIDAPRSTKNNDKARDPDMHQTKKGNQWYFGRKAHIGVDSQSKLIHSVAATAANVHDSQMLEDLLHGDETRVWGDSAYAGQGDTIRDQAPNAKDFTHKQGCRNRPLNDGDKAKNKTKSKVRAKVEHPFLILKRVFRFNKVRNRGFEKNATRLIVACGLVNLYRVRRRLLRAT
jgi:IS5 family transposase